MKKHLNKNTVAFIGLITILLSTYFYVYTRGLQEGEQRYKQSRRMYMALKSAYHYGYQDCKKGLREDWNGPELKYVCSDCTAPVFCYSITNCP